MLGEEKQCYCSNGEGEKSQVVVPCKSFLWQGLLLGLGCFHCCFFPLPLKLVLSIIYEKLNLDILLGSDKPSLELWPPAAVCGCILGPAKIRWWQLRWSHGTVCYLHFEVKKKEHCTEAKVSQRRLIVWSQWKGAAWARKAEYTQ